MQTKLIEILSSATGWMTAAEIADKGKWRSAANVGLALKQMTDAECRTSPTKKAGNGMPAKEYKLSDKSFAGDEVAANPATKKSLTVSSKSPATVVDSLIEKVQILEAETADARIVFGNLRKTLSIGEDESMKLAIEKLQSDMRHANETIRALDTDKTNALQSLYAASEETDRLRAENVALKTLDKSMPGFGAAYEAQKAKKPSQPRRPFSVTGLVGFHTGSNKVTLFLDRRLSARSVTLPADKLAKLAEMAGAQ